MSTSLEQQITEEKRKLSERLAKLDSERSRLADQITDLESADRVLKRMSATAAATARTPEARRRGPQATTAAMPEARKSISDMVIDVVGAALSGDVVDAAYIQRGLKVRGITVQPHHLGVALWRHKKAGRLERIGEAWRLTAMPADRAAA